MKTQCIVTLGTKPLEIHTSRKFLLEISNVAVPVKRLKIQPNIGITNKFIDSVIKELGDSVPAANAGGVIITTLGSNVTPLEALGEIEGYDKSDAKEIGSGGFQEIFTANKTWFSITQVIRILLICSGSKPDWNAFFSKKGSTSFILKGKKGVMKILVVEWYGLTPTLKISGLGSGRGYNNGSRLVIPIAKPSRKTPKE